MGKIAILLTVIMAAVLFTGCRPTPSDVVVINKGDIDLHLRIQNNTSYYSDTVSAYTSGTASAHYNP